MSIPKQELLDDAVNNYYDADASTLYNMDKVSLFKKIGNEVQLIKLADKLMNDLEPYKKESFMSISVGDIKQIRDSFLAFLTKQDRKSLLYDLPFLELFMKVGYFDTADQLFARAAKEDGNLQTLEVFQGLRNFWITNSLQMFFGLPVQMKDSIYALSLLYPYTDNFLDDININVEEKDEFNHRFEDYITGAAHEPKNSLESKVFELFNLIAEQYDRSEFPKIYEAMQILQDTQIDAMKQYSEEPLDRDELLRIVFLKGGMTVLTDALLVKPNLSAEDMQFTFNYGSLLQMLDDFEDTVEDFNEGHKTLFSTKNGFLDKEVEKLIGYIFKVTEETEKDTEIQKFLKEIIKSCSFLLISSAIARNKNLVSKRFYKDFESVIKVRLTFFNKLDNYLDKSLNQFDFTEPIGKKNV